MRSLKEPLCTTFPACKHVDAVGLFQRGQAVGDDDPGGGQGGEVPHDLGLALVIEPVGRLVEQHDPRAADHRAGDRDALTLAAGEDGSACPDHRHHAHGHGPDFGFELGDPNRRPYLLARHFLLVADQIVPEILRMEPDRLRDGADLPSHLFQVQMSQVAPVVIDSAGGRAVDSEREPEQGALAGAGFAGDRDELAGARPNRDVVEDQRAVRVVAEGNAVEQDLPAQIPRPAAPRPRSRESRRAAGASDRRPAAWRQPCRKNRRAGRQRTGRR